jgi:hypothetical protein
MERDEHGRQVIRLPNGDRMRFRCCFCTEYIESVGYDPCAIVAITKWDADEEEQSSQQFWCHGECLRHRLEPMSRENLVILDE